MLESVEAFGEIGFRTQRPVVVLDFEFVGSFFQLLLNGIAG